jgi:signal recognition particle receptor subunit beta
MVLFNYSTKELTAKVVYYGPGLCGKTTNLQWIHEKTPIKNKGKMLSLATEADRTLFFDFLPIDLGTIRGMKTRIQLYTVPGQVFYNATRRMVLKGADCVVFVADSQEPMLDANLDAWANLRENLEANEIDPDEIPTVLQYNKRDLPNALPVEILNERLNGRSLPFFEAVAMKGQGVDETLKSATAMVFKSLAAKYGGGEAAAASAPAAGARPAAAAPPVAARPAPSPSPAARVSPSAVAPPRSAPAPVMAATSADELLESLDFQPAPELSLDSAGAESADEEELSLDAPIPSAARGPAPGKTTLVRTGAEVDDLRQRIGRPADPELTLDEVDQDDEDIEEISFDTSPGLLEAEMPEPARAAVPAPPAPVRPAVPAARAAGPVPAPRPTTNPAVPALPVSPPPPAPRAATAPRPTPPARTPPPPVTASGSVTIPPVGAAPSSGPTENTNPIRASATVGSGARSVAVPVEVTVKNGRGQVEIQLRIVLDLKMLP